MTTAIPAPAAVQGAPIPVNSAKRSLIVSVPAEDHIFIDRHCPECGMLEPHHKTHCVWRD